WLGLRHTRKALLHIHCLYNIDWNDPSGLSLINRLRRSLLLSAETKLIRSYPNIFTLSTRLCLEFHTLLPPARLLRFPLALDLSLYPFDTTYNPAPQPMVSLIGSFYWEPTVSASLRLITRLWPKIRRLVPEAHLQIVGRHARTALAHFLGRPDISVYENV